MSYLQSNSECWPNASALFYAFCPQLVWDWPASNAVQQRWQSMQLWEWIQCPWQWCLRVQLWRWTHFENDPPFSFLFMKNNRRLVECIAASGSWDGCLTSPWWFCGGRRWLSLRRFAGWMWCIPLRIGVWQGLREGSISWSRYYLFIPCLCLFQWTCAWSSHCFWCFLLKLSFQASPWFLRSLTSQSTCRWFAFASEAAAEAHLLWAFWSWLSSWGRNEAQPNSWLLQITTWKSKDSAFWCNISIRNVQNSWRCRALVSLANWRVLLVWQEQAFQSAKRSSAYERGKARAAHIDWCQNFWDSEPHRRSLSQCAEAPGSTLMRFHMRQW